MKTKLFSAVLIIMCLTLTSLDVLAQKYAKVTIYTNTQQDVSGTLRRRNIDNSSWDWSMNFSFYSYEGQTVDGGYMYQRWIQLENWSFPDPVGYNYYLQEVVYSEQRNTGTYSPQTWPTYVYFTGIDFRDQGGQ